MKNVILLPKVIVFIIMFLFVFPVFCLADTVFLPQTGQTASSVVGDDGDLEKGAAWPLPRFIDNGDGTITDRLTGLMWLRKITGQVYQYLMYSGWGTMFVFVNDLNDTEDLWGNFENEFHTSVYTARYTDWRLPNVNELKSLVNAGQGDPASWLNSQGFDIFSGSYWSSTSDAVGNEKWAVRLWDGGVDNWPGSWQCYPLPVRGPIDGRAEVWKTGQTVSYYQGELDDGGYEVGVAWPAPRFEDNGDGTIADNLTGLVWLKDAGHFGFMSWDQAVTKVADFSANPGNYNAQEYTASYDDWRLPNRKEIHSLIDFSRTNPPLQTGHPFLNVQDDPYWTSTTYASDDTKAWRVFFTDGVLDSLQKASDPGQWWFQSRVWPVRGGFEAPPLPPAYLKDAIFALRVVCGMDPSGAFTSIEVNGDGKIGLEEAIYVLQLLAGTR